jgi:hypothetical protein
VRLIRLRYDGICVVCQLPVAARTEAWWDSVAKTVTCTACRPPAPQQFEAGRSAQRVADRRDAKKRQTWDDAGRLKKAAIWIRNKPSGAKSWSRGAEGERIVGARLDKLEQEGLIVALHDIRIPGSSANVDHVAVAPSGVHIIDAKYYKNAQIEVVNKGGWINKDIQLRVAKRNRTNLVDKLAKQIVTVDAAIRDVPLPTTVTPVLCFVHGSWGLLSKGYKLNGVHIVWPKKLEELLRRPGPLSAEWVIYVGDLLKQRLRPA